MSEKDGYSGRINHICEKCGLKFYSYHKTTRFCCLQHYIERNISVIDGIVHKKCLKCEVYKPMTLEYFYSSSLSKNGFLGYCRECESKKHKTKKWRTMANNSQRKRRELDGGRDSDNEYRQRPEVKERINLNAMFRKKNDPMFALRVRTRVLIYIAIRRLKTSPTLELLVGYSVDDLRNHIESLFTDGMNWNRFMAGEIHIDHKTPISSFNYTNPEDEDFKRCWALENLQPMWAIDNIKKRGS